MTSVSVSQTEINASVSDQIISASSSSSPINVLSQSQTVSVSIPETSLSVSVPSGGGVSVSTISVPITVTVSPSGGGGGGGDSHDPVTIGTANGLSLSGQILSLGLASSGVAGALSGADWNTFAGKQNALTFPIASNLGGTGINNTGTFTNQNNSTIIGGGTLNLGGFSLTVPASGAVALLATANVFTAHQQITVATASAVGLTIKTSDNNETNPAWRLLNSSNTSIASLEADGILKLNNGLALPAFDAVGPDYAIKIVRQSNSQEATGLYFQNKRNNGYAEFFVLNDVEAGFSMGIGGDAETFGYDNVAYLAVNPSVQFMTLDVYAAGQYINFNTAAGETVQIREGGMRLLVIKSGATQAAAGAVAKELWKTNGHATLPNNVLMIGV